MLIWPRSKSKGCGSSTTASEEKPAASHGPAAGAGEARLTHRRAPACTLPKTLQRSPGTPSSFRDALNSGSTAWTYTAAISGALPEAVYRIPVADERFPSTLVSVPRPAAGRIRGCSTEPDDRRPQAGTLLQRDRDGPSTEFKDVGV